MAKKKKTISVKTKKPDGLQVVRSNEKLTVSWKRKDSNYGAGQQLQYRLNSGSWVSIGINSTITAKVYSIPVGNYNPTNKKEAYKLTSVQFRVRGKRTKYTKGSGKKRKTYVPTWSDWAQVTYSLQTPNAPKAGASLNETYDNISTFSFSPSKGNNANQMFRWCEWQSVLVKDCGYKDGAKAPWASGKLGWQTGTTNAWTNSGSKTITENTATLASGSHTRWFRVRTRGIAGDSAWAYTKHVYAKPLDINNLTATASKTSSGYTVTSKWTTRWSEANPVDFIVAQYAIGTPTENMAAPSGASWTDAGTIKDAAGDEGLTFAVDDTLNEDECLFVRAYSQHDHDSNRTPSNVAIAAYGYLKDPEDLTVQTDDTTFRATVTAENTSQVAGSFLAITYRPTTVEDSFIVGIIPSGSTSVTVQCPDWSQETAVAFGVQAIKGSYTAKQRADGAYTYEITKKMESEATLWDGGAVPLAPANVTANPTDIESTIRVAWDWSWTSANKAILSWSDHEDAWESTDEPSEYTVSNIHAASWNIAGLETGKTWYIRVRLSKETGDKETMGPWSDIIPVDLSSAPSIPSLVLSQGSIPADGSVTASWGYTSRDGMGQAYAEICEATITGQGITYGEVIARTQTAQHVTINAADVGWESGETYNLCVRVVSSAGRESDSWSAPVAITIADPITAVIEETSLVEQAVIYDEQTLTPGAIVSFETDSEKTFTELTATIVPQQSGTPWQSAIENAPYLYRPTSGGTISHNYFRELDKIVGGSVVFNQLATIPPSDISRTRNGVVIVDNRDGTYTISTDENGATDDAYIALPPPQVINGHRYYFRSLTSNGSTNTYYAYITGNVTQPYDYGNGSIGYARGDGSTFPVPIFVKSGTVITTPITVIPQLFDLTQMFGTTIADYVYQLEQSTAGSGVNYLKSLGYFTDDYYPYNSGEIKSVSGLDSHDMVGFNQWDEEWEVGGIDSSTGANVTDNTVIRSKNYIKVCSNTTYYLKCGSGGTFNYRLYDENKAYIIGTYISANSTLTIPSGASYLRFVMGSSYGTTYNNDICINISDTNRNGEYEPYIKHSYPLDNTITLRGIPKITDGKIYYDGDTYNSDGSVTRKYGVVDLGTLNWNYQSAQTRFYTSELQGLIKPPYTGSEKPNCLCSSYKITSFNDFASSGDFALGTTGNAFIMDSNYTDATAFKTAMQGVYLIYELAEPTTESAEPYSTVQICDGSGTEEYVTDGIPVGHETKYAEIYPLTGYDKVKTYVSPTQDEEDATVYNENLPFTTYSGEADVVTGTLNAYPYYASYNGETLNGEWVCDRAVYSQGATPPIGSQVVLISGESTTYTLTPQTINTLAGVNNVWVDSGSITEAKIADFSYDALCLTEMPLTVTITGAGDGGTTTLALERSAPYHLERPDGTDLNGHEGETIALVSQPGEEEFTITQNDLLGYLDDGAHYRIVATVQDSFGQSNEARLDFEVHWDHQAIMPEATAEIDTDYNIAKITATAPAGAIEGDTFDIYRLSVDRPELIVQNGTWGTVYVDPYPAIGEFGGHRVVFKTVNGDFITADNRPAWLDLQEDEGDLLDLDYSIIDFDGESIPIEYNVDIKTDFDKDFRETKYLGGSVVGDWNPAVSRSGSIDAVAVVQDDPETIQALRRLAVYPGIAHVRSKDGSSYAANVNVSDQISYNVAGKQLDVSLNITRVDPEGFEGLTYAQWYTEESE